MAATAQQLLLRIAALSMPDARTELSEGVASTLYVAGLSQRQVPELETQLLHAPCVVGGGGGGCDLPLVNRLSVSLGWPKFFCLDCMCGPSAGRRVLS